MSLLESLHDLSTIISGITDLEIAEDLTKIYEDIVSRTSAMSRKYWKLVRTLAVLEKARDRLMVEIDMLANDDLPLD